jgi:hypothetical protein
MGHSRVTLTMSIGSLNMYITYIKYILSNKNAIRESALSAKLLTLAIAVNLSLTFMKEPKTLKYFILESSVFKRRQQGLQNIICHSFILEH